MCSTKTSMFWRRHTRMARSVLAKSRTTDGRMEALKRSGGTLRQAWRSGGSARDEAEPNSSPAAMIGSSRRSTRGCGSASSAPVSLRKNASFSVCSLIASLSRNEMVSTSLLWKRLLSMIFVGSSRRCALLDSSLWYSALRPSGMVPSSRSSSVRERRRPLNTSCTRHPKPQESTALCGRAWEQKRGRDCVQPRVRAPLWRRPGDTLGRPR